MGVEEPFSEFQPVQWKPQSAKSPIYSIRRQHGVKTQYLLRNENDEINVGRSPLEQVLLEYQVNGKQKPINHQIYTFENLFNSHHDVNGAGRVNVTGDVAERIARRVVKYFLQHYSDDGHIGELFRNDFSKTRHDEYIVAHNTEYVLKIKKYPNMVLLQKTGQGKFGYEEVMEIDGLFDYRYKESKNIVVVESKLSTIDTKPARLTRQMQMLQGLWPEAKFWYVMMAGKNQIYHGPERWQQLNSKPVKIYESLRKQGMGALFFTFNETRSDFDRMTTHIVNQYRLANNMHVTLHERTVVSDNEIVIYDGGERPIIWLHKDAATGVWKDVKTMQERSAA